jgi:glutamate formiminotransferase / formiminotetrahydrofolate cyclodeaminase
MRALCVAAFSEGRREGVIDAVAKASGGAPGATLLHRTSDEHHNRTVLTIAGAPDALAEAAFRFAAEAIRLVDLAQHDGVHPRLGAADEIAFVPLDESLKDCVRLATAVAARIEAELGVPTRLFGAACPKGTTLWEIRKEAPKGHASAGITCVGARGPVVYFNVNIGSRDMDLAKRIAAEVRKLPGVRALAFPLRDGAQVSTEIFDWKETSPLRVLAEVMKHAPVRGTEVVGMIQQDALAAGFAEALGCAPPTVLDLPPPTLLDRLAAPTSSPGGGSAAAHVGAVAAALVEMCTGLSELEAPRARAEQLRLDLEALAEEDAAAFASYIETRSDEALKRATLAPLLIAEKSAEVLLLAQGAAPKVAKPALPDLKGAMRFAGAASEHAAATAKYNLGDIADKDFVQDARLRLLRIP